MDDDGTRWRDGDGGELRRRLRRGLATLDATPAELAGLAILLAGGVACLVLLVWWARPAAAPVAGPVRPAEAGTTVTVHVAGAVVAPGVLELPASARVVDAVEAAGGATVLADLGALNLARTLSDGERIEVPTRGTAGDGPPGAGPGDDGAFDSEGRLDLNRATAAELESLPGIGPVLAQRIVDHREANGPFASAGALREVPGIGERSFQRLAELVVVP